LQRRLCGILEDKPSLEEDNQVMHPGLKTTRETSERMKRIRQANTEPELAVRRFLTSQNVKYRTCVSTLPGKPDIANQSRRWAIFVHGCFWHGHEGGCALATRPKRNAEFWAEKIHQNQARDHRKEQALRDMGFLVETVWQCETHDEERLRKHLERILALYGRPTPNAT
jgi:DNA mismatch endonuclease (patch repair protein)